MKRDFDAVVQMGHVARKKGATGTSGPRGTEQAFVSLLGPKIVTRLETAGLTVALVGADDPRPTAEVFVSLHQDGSKSANAHGASVGFPVHGDGETLTRIWKSLYTLAGWPFGFRRANYTIGLRWFYAFGGLRRTWWRKAKYDAAFLIEHGFSTTLSETNWMWDHLEVIADADANTIIQYLTGTRPTETTMGLQRGDTGPEVRALQTILNGFAKAGLVVDGDYGPATEAAVRRYQQALGVPVDGVWGSASVAAHNKFVVYLAAAPAAPTPQPPPVDPPTPSPALVPVDELRPLIAQIDKIRANLEALIIGAVR